MKTIRSTGKNFITGNAAVAQAVKLCSVGVISAYPITPQTPIVEQLAEFVANKEIDAEYVRVESEHSALSACIGACMSGTRSFTATSSHGLAYMHEMLTFASGSRFPLVLTVANRSVAAPWSIWGDHHDAVMQRDTGWIQIYVENAQEAADMVIQAYKIAEHPSVYTPVMICLDGFHVSHTEELVEFPAKELVDKFLPTFSTPGLLDPDNPLSVSFGAPGKEYTVWRYEQQRDINNALTVIKDVDQEYGKLFSRSYGGVIDNYNCDDAEVAFVIMGSYAGAAKDAADILRQKGINAGVLRMRAFRPFPTEDVKHALRNVKKVLVIDREISYGYAGALFTEIRGALFGTNKVKVVNYIAGLAGSSLLAGELVDIITKEKHEKLGKEVIFQFVDV